MDAFSSVSRIFRYLSTVAKAYLHRAARGGDHDHLARWVFPGRPDLRNTRRSYITRVDKDHSAENADQTAVLKASYTK